MGSLSQGLASHSKEEVEDIKERGVVVVKNVLLEKGSLAMKESLKEHIKRNSRAKGFPHYDFVHCLKLRNGASPTDSPVVYKLHWSSSPPCVL